MARNQGIYTVFIACGFIFSPFLTQNISIAVTWPSSNDFIQNQVSFAKKIYSDACFSLIIFSCRTLQFENQFKVSKSCDCLQKAFGQCAGMPSRRIQWQSQNCHHILPCTSSVEPSSMLTAAEAEQTVETTRMATAFAHSIREERQISSSVESPPCLCK